MRHRTRMGVDPRKRRSLRGRHQCLEAWQVYVVVEKFIEYLLLVNLTQRTPC